MWDTLMALLMYDELKYPNKKVHPVGLIIFTVVTVVICIVCVKAFIFVVTLGGLFK